MKKRRTKKEQEFLIISLPKELMRFKKFLKSKRQKITDSILKDFQNLFSEERQEPSSHFVYVPSKHELFLKKFTFCLTSFKECGIIDIVKLRKENFELQNFRCVFKDSKEMVVLYSEEDVKILKIKF